MRCSKIGHKAIQCPQGGPGRGPAGGKGSGIGFVYTNWMSDEPDIKNAESHNVEAIYSVQENDGAKAIIDCGASESIVGALTLQDVCAELDALGFNCAAGHEVSKELRVWEQPEQFGSGACRGDRGHPRDRGEDRDACGGWADAHVVVRKMALRTATSSKGRPSSQAGNGSDPA